MNASTASTQQPGGAPPDLIQTLPFLAGLPTAEVVGLVRTNTTQVDHPPGALLVEQGREAEFVYYVVRGRVRVVRRRPDDAGVPVTIVDRVVGPGYLVGRYALIYNLKYTSTARTEEPVTLLKIQIATLERLLYRYPQARERMAPQAIINRLRTLPLFVGVDLVTLSYLAEEVREETVAEDQVIYTQDQPAARLYLIHKGQVTLYDPRQAGDRLWLGTGCAFGFPGSIGARRRGQTVYGHWATARARTTLYGLPWTALRQVARRFPQVIDPASQRVPAATLADVSVFQDLTPEERVKLAGFCSFQHIPQHHLIMQQGDIGDSLWILLKGSRALLSALDGGARALPRTPVDGIVYFGETALLATRNVESTVEAEPGSLWLRLHWQDFQHFLQLCGPELVDRLHIRLPQEVSAAVGPQRQDYAWLGKGEILLVLRRRHWLALLQKLRLAAFVLLFDVALTVALVLLGVGLHWPLIAGVALLVPAVIWGVVDYLNDYFIVTNQRVIQQEKVVFTSEQRREALLEQIQRVDIQTSFWGNLFGYGTLSVYTAGTTGSIDFDLVHHPGSLRGTIFHQRGLRYLRYRAESKLEIQNALQKRLGLTVDLPSRVLAYRARRSSNQPAGLNWWQTFLHYITVDSQLQWESTERIVWHKHWFILARQVGPLLLLLLLVMVAMAGGLAFIDVFRRVESFVDETLISLELVLGVVMLGILSSIVWIVADWWNDTYIVTRDRIIDVEKLPLLLSEERREAQLSEIQDIRLEISSPIEVLLNYGNVIVQTAAKEGAFTFDHVPNPRAVKEEITRRLIEWRREDERRKARDRIRDLPDWFEMYNRLGAGQEPRRPVTDEHEES